MTNTTRSEQKIKEIQAHLETEKIHIPPFGNFIKIKQMDEFLTELKSEVIEDLSELHNIQQMKERIILEAQEEADRIRQEVRAEIERQDIVMQARDISRDMIQKSQTKAESILVEAKELRKQLIVNSHKYVDNLFSDFEKDLVETQQKITENREQLRINLDNKMEMMQESNY